MLDIQKIRADFPILKEQINGKPLAYFDNAATSQTPQVVIDTIVDYYSRYNANIHRGVHTLSQVATDAYEQARIKLQKHFNAKEPYEMIFTAGTTHAINIVAMGFSTLLKKGDEVLVSALEHHSNIVPWQMLCERTGALLRVIPMNAQGELLMDAYASLLNFTWKDFQARNNNELVAVFGNFINRVVVLTNKYYGGVVPTPTVFSETDEAVLEQIKAYPQKISKSIERYRFREALSELMNFARLGNKYLADEEPWKQIKTNPERVQTIMYVALQIATGLSVVCEPFLPFTARKLKDILNTSQSTLEWSAIESEAILLATGHQIGQATLLFAKIEDAEVQHQLDKLEATKKANDMEQKEAAPLKEEITFEDFSKMDIRTGTILEAEKMPKAKKLLVLKVDTGVDVRTVVSGIAESFKPEEIIGQQVSVLVNLAPRKLRGVESQGMILMTDTKDGKLAFVQPSSEGVDNGAQIS